MFAVEGDSIRYGLGAIKGVGQAVDGMIAERVASAFRDLRDLCRRIDLAGSTAACSRH